jgi:ABC-type transporter Mla MlaB component
MKDTMQTNHHRLKDESNTSAQRKIRLIAKGNFTIGPSENKCTLKLKGNFNNKSINDIRKGIRTSKSFRRKCIELDMSAVKTIDMRTMALFIISLKTLNENGTHTQVTGLNGDKLKLANELGMYFVTQIT